MENQTQKRIPGLWWLLLLEGITTIILGILLISQPAGTLAVIVIFLGIYWLIEGIFSLIRMFTHSGRAHWAWSLLSGILGIVAGILVLAQPMLSSIILTTTLVIIIAIQGILIGILDIVRGVQGDGAAVRCSQPEAEAQRRRLTGTVQPEQAETAARFDQEAEADHHFGAGIGLAQSGNV